MNGITLRVARSQKSDSILHVATQMIAPLQVAAAARPMISSTLFRMHRTSHLPTEITRQLIFRASAAFGTCRRSSRELSYSRSRNMRLPSYRIARLARLL